MVVEHTFFLMESCAMAVLCQYRLVSFTMMKEIGIIIISGCAYESLEEWAING